MKKRLAFVALAATCALLTAGCGSDDNSDSSGDDTTPTTSAATSDTMASSDTPSSDDTTSSDDEGGGSDPGSGYCSDLKTIKSTFADDGLSDLNQETFDKIHDAAKTIAAEAPADVQDDWNTLIDALEGLQAILDKYGIDFNDFDDLQNGQLPGDLTRQQLQKLGVELNKFISTTHVESATKAITKSVKDTCGFKLNDN